MAQHAVVINKIGWGATLEASLMVVLFPSSSLAAARVSWDASSRLVHNIQTDVAPVVAHHATHSCTVRLDINGYEHLNTHT